MNTDLAALVAVCLFIIAALAAVLVVAEVLGHKAKARRTAAQSCPELDADDLDALRALVAGLDNAVERYLAAVRAGGRDDDAIALLGLLDRANISAGRLGALAAALASAARTARIVQSRGAKAGGADTRSDDTATRRPGEGAGA